jgi:glycosyltransferase involved in cell wall biosynthesis
LQKDLAFEKKHNVKIIRLNHYFTYSTRIFYKGLFKVIDRIKPNLLYLHGIADFGDLLLLKKKKPYKIVRDSHQSWVASVNIFRKFFYFFYRHTFAQIINRTNIYEKIYALGIEEKEYLINLGINESKVTLLPHGYNEETMKFSLKDRKNIRNILSISDTTKLIGYIGKFDSIKCPDLIFSILKLIPDNTIDFSQIKLLFLGPKDKSYMNHFYKQLNSFIKIPQDNIIVKDALNFEELFKYFSAIDICIFPKACTLSSIHAQICGAKVIMENYSSNKERVKNQNHLFEPGNLRQAANILEKILKNKDIFYRQTEENKLYFSSREYKNQILELENLMKNEKV